MCVCIAYTNIFVVKTWISCESYLEHAASRRERRTLIILSAGVARIDFNKKQEMMSLSFLEKGLALLTAISFVQETFILQLRAAKK